MKKYFIRRLLRVIPHVFLVVSVVFFVFRWVPGDPALIFAGQEATPAEIEAVRQDLGLHEPIIFQYFKFLAGILRGDLGTSMSFGIPVTEVIVKRFPATALLALTSIILAVLLAIPAGIISAVRPTAFYSQMSMLGVLGLLAVPNFWLGLLLIQLLAVHFQILPVTGTGGFKFLIMPTIAVAARLLAILARTTRASVIEILHEDFVRTAHAKGLSELCVIMKHALGAALIPIITVIGLQTGQLLGGAIVIETLFTYQGIGLALIRAVSVRDYFLVQGIIIFYAFTFIVINLITDLCYAYVDPRVRYE